MAKGPQNRLEQGQQKTVKVSGVMKQPEDRFTANKVN